VIVDMQDWTHIHVPRKNLYLWSPSQPIEYFGNQFHVMKMTDWCANIFEKDVWVYRMADDGSKQFSFRDPKDATLFSIRWL
jgi:hypothetical protein